MFLTRDRPEQFSSFLVRSFQLNQITMRLSLVSKAYHFLKKLANCVIACYFTVFYDAENFVSKYFENALIEFDQTLP